MYSIDDMYSCWNCGMPIKPKEYDRNSGICDRCMQSNLEEEQAKYGKDYDDWRESKIAEKREG